MPDVGAVGEDVRKDADKLGYAPAELIQLGGFVCGQRAVALHEFLAQQWQSSQGVRVVQEHLQAGR